MHDDRFIRPHMLRSTQNVMNLAESQARLEMLKVAVESLIPNRGMFVKGCTTTWPQAQREWNSF